MNNILYITPYAFIQPNAGGKFAMYEQIKNLNKHCNLTVVGVDTNKIDNKLGVTVLPLFKNSKWRYANPLYFFKLKKLIAAKNIDTIIVEHPYLGWLVMLLKWATGVQVFIRSQNVEYLRFKDLGKPWWPILKVYEKWVHNNSTGVLCITEDDYAFFKKQGIKSKLINYPFGTNVSTNPTDRNECKTKVCLAHNLSADTKVIMYNGALNYLPNMVGLDIIINEVAPYLEKNYSNYKIIICGGNLPQKYNKLQGITNLIYTGFVDDISMYFKAADVFINPVQGGGGIKTKLVDALSYGTTAISSVDGAKGLVQKVAGNKLHITPDYNGTAMAKKIIEVLAQPYMPTPASYYAYYNWSKITERLLLSL